MRKTIMLLAVLLIITVALAVYSIGASTTGAIIVEVHDEFAKCLTDKGVKIYGAYWCQHCQNQRKMFGGSWQYVSYVECVASTGQAQECVSRGIRVYPTWDINGALVEGELSFEELSRRTGCILQ